MLVSIVCDPHRLGLSPPRKRFCSEEMINLFQVLTGGLMDVFQVCDLPVYTNVPTVANSYKGANLSKHINSLIIERIEVTQTVYNPKTIYITEI